MGRSTNFYEGLFSISLLWLLVVACEGPVSHKEKELYANHCGSCHLAPAIESLPKEIWQNNILPDMAARMGIREGDYNPYKGYSFDEMEAMMKTGIYQVEPAMEYEEWIRLRDYIINSAPDSLPANPDQQAAPLSGFEEIPLVLDSIPGAKNITFLKYSDASNSMNYADLSGAVYQYQWDQNQIERIGQFPNPVVGYETKDSTIWVNTIGQISPTQLPTGRLFTGTKDQMNLYPDYFHRPVQMLVEDLDQDGDEDIIISEFGDLVGQLSLLENEEGKDFKKRILHKLPGTIRVIARDMNNDSMKDLVVLTAQGEEGILIYYQDEPMDFRAERVLRFSPVFGTSWFELLDYDGDGDQDLVTVHGDNADKSYVHKPYHGFRIHLNDGQNKYEEAFFYPLNGATRVLPGDFDQDGDIDFCLLATFPDYEKDPIMPFVYLKNENSEDFIFETELLNNPSLGRWLLADSGDIDRDGDQDIILSSFTYVFTPVPDSLNAYWNRQGVDMLILKNKLKNDD